MARTELYNEAILTKAQKYLDNYSVKHQHPFPSVVGLSRILNIAHSTIKRWRNDDNKIEFRATLEKIKDQQHLQLIHKGITGDYHASIVKLMLYNFGYSEKQKLETSDNKITTVMLRADFSTPIDFNKLSDAEVIDFARADNKKRIDKLRKIYNKRELK